MGAQQWEPDVTLLSTARIRGESTWYDERAKNNRSTRSLTECGAFAKTDSNEVVKLFQNEAEGAASATVHQKKNTQGYLAEVNLPCKCPWVM